jgi:hypothetical protein
MRQQKATGSAAQMHSNLNVYSALDRATLLPVAVAAPAPSSRTLPVAVAAPAASLTIPASAPAPAPAAPSWPFATLQQTEMKVTKEKKKAHAQTERKEKEQSKKRGNVVPHTTKETEKPDVAAASATGAFSFSESESDDGFVHHTRAQAFEVGSACFVEAGSSIRGAGTVTGLIKCKTDGHISKYVVELHSGDIHRVRAVHCFSIKDTTVAKDKSETFTLQEDGDAGSAQEEAQQPPAEQPGKQPGDDDDFDQKQQWCHTTRLLAWAKIREKNPWAQTERMASWAECAKELRDIIDKAIQDTLDNNVPPGGRVDPKYRLYLKGVDAKGQDKDGHALQNMFARHAGRAKATNEAEQKTSGHGVKRGTQKDQEEREILMELLQMQEQAELYRRSFRSTKQTLKQVQEKDCHTAIVRQVIGEEVVAKKELELLQQTKRELQRKVEVLQGANAAMSAEDKATLNEVLDHFKRLDEAQRPPAPGSDATSRSGGRGGGRAKRNRGDAFESAMATLGTAALRMTQGSDRVETPFETTARLYMEHKMRDSSPRALSQDESDDALKRRLQNLRKWKDEGIITDAAYNEAVAKLVLSMSV